MTRLCLIFIFASKTLIGQVTFTNGIDAASIITLLSQDSLTITDVSINCDSLAYGEFEGSSELPITHGLIISTGNAAAAFAPNASPSTTTAFGTSQIIPGFLPTQDICSIEFDATSQRNYIEFVFSFGSEEYPEYVYSPYNDQFSILVNGGIYSNWNMARLPDNTSTSISHVNDFSNSSVFYNNTFPPGTFVTYDGLTSYLRARVVVLPNQTYHFTILIGDQDDPNFDSAGFIAASDSENHGLEVRPAFGVECYPNPVVYDVYWMPANGVTINSVKLYDQLGKEIYTVPDPTRQRSIDMSQYACGMYSLQIETAFFNFPFQIIKLAE